MAHITMGSFKMNNKRDIGTVDHKYNYPNGLKLKPGDKLHDDLVKEVLNRGQESRDIMEQKYDSWNFLDKTLTSYIRADDLERALKSDDERKPISIVVPFSYATLETLVTYQVAVFLQDPMFQYEPFDSSDLIGASLLESLVRMQTIKAKMGLNLHTMFRDQYVYGFGAVAPGWTVKHGWKTVKQETGFMSRISNVFQATGAQKERVEAVLYEGSTLTNIDPYSALPDPNVSIHELNKGEFFGYLDETNYNDMLREERAGNYFNVKYMEQLSDMTSTYFDKDDDRDIKHNTPKPGNKTYTTKPVHNLHMYIDIIPKDFELGDSEYPEIWKFTVAGDCLLVDARPLDLDFNQIPVVVSAADFDGYSLTPVSRIEVIYGMQEVLNWMINSHVSNVRKSINDMLVVDPFMVNIADLEDPDAGKLIRLRKRAWGRGIKDAVMQLKVDDITRGHVQDAGFFIDMMQRVSAAVDSVMGIMSTGERKSATEARDTRMGALSRLERSSRVTSIMAMQDLAYMFASQTQQLMTEETAVQIVGRRQQELLEEYGIEYERTNVTPLDILIDFDVIPHDGTSPQGSHGEAMTQMFQIIATQPELAQKFDLFRIFEHIAKAEGAKNIQDFRAKPGNIGIGGDTDVANQAQAGNLVDIREAGLG